MDRERDDEDTADLTPASWLKFGQRNVLYLGFVVLLLPFGMALDGPGPPGGAIATQSLGGLAFAVMLCGAVSLGFFVINAGLVVIDLAKGRRAAKALIGCVLPAVVGIGSLLVR
ncbi:MAG: hypothetical protein EXR07_10610 [Acetobacteraceae bacterium]|nr:hypothetical protein [Acetobacteraceae bacterium]